MGEYHREIGEMMENREGITIVQLAPPQNTSLGDYFYRVESPGRSMSKDERVRAVINICSISNKSGIFCRYADILIINHVCEPDLIPIIIERKNRGLPTVMEIGDNINDIQPWNMTYNFWKNNENKETYLYLLNIVDAIQTNNIMLFKTFQKYNKKGAIFPNNLDKIPSEPEINEKNRITIGWGGSYGHLYDIKEVSPYLIKWLKQNPEDRIAIMAAEDIANIFKEVPPDQKIIFSPGGIEDYYRFIQNIDIGIAPLNDTEYNRCRSDIKFVEYAGYGACAILQDLDPYNGQHIPEGTRYLYKYPWQLPHVLNQLKKSPEFRRELINNAYKYVKENRIEYYHSKERIEFYQNLINNKTKHIYPPEMSDLEDYLLYREDRIDNLLFNGLIYLESYHEPERAGKLFLEAAEIDPDNYLTYLFLSQCSDEPIKYLKLAIEKNPNSIKSYLLMGRLFEKGGDLKSALDVYKSLISRFPDYPIPYKRAANILKQIGKEDQADKLLSIINKRPDKSDDRHNNCYHGSEDFSVNYYDAFLIFPTGRMHGWGVCGRYLTKEIGDIIKIGFITDELIPDKTIDEFEYHELKRVLLTQEQVQTILKGSNNINIPVLQAIQGSNMLPWGLDFKVKKRIGYTFFEENILSTESIENAKKNFKIVVAGSTWNEIVLKEHGLNNVTTVIQGIDETIFNPFNNKKRFFTDRFVIFSGGKFEFRKGQDLIIACFKHLQKKYDDVYLVISWFNSWKGSIETMRLSKHIKFNGYNDNYIEFMNRLLNENGIDMKRVLILPPKPNYLMARIYKNTDIGIFPNRCEGGTNLVLMEYMACGKPVIASYSTGHRDILNENNAILLKDLKKIEIKSNGRLIAIWDDPDLDELIAKIEWAYENRDKIIEKGQYAGEYMKNFTWRRSAEEFVRIIQSS